MAGVWQYGKASWSPVTSSVFRLKARIGAESNKERRLNNTKSGLHNLLWEMEGAKPRKDEHAPLFECFSETEDPDILR